MVYVEILASVIVVLILVAMVTSVVEAQRAAFEEAIRQEKAQLIAENIFWETLVRNPSILDSQPTEFSTDIEVTVDGHTYVVTLRALKFERPDP